MARGNSGFGEGADCHMIVVSRSDGSEPRCVGVGVPSDDPPPSSPAPDQAVRATWQGAAGTVVASCTGARISLVAAQPNSGWRVEVGDRGPEELSVHFELSEDEDGEDDRLSSRLLGQEVEIRAQCSRGRPSFSAGDLSLIHI